MNKRVMTIIAGAVFFLLPGTSALAGETVYRFDPVTQSSRALVFGNLWAGYQAYRENCKSCHFRGNDQGAVFLNEDSRTMRGWNNIFFKRNVRCAKDGSWDSLSEEDLRKVNDYLYSKAYDTWNPNSATSCG
ncbi:hypothetical protein ACUUL3_09610 [Thiovibrio sp. JS02]